MSPDRRSQHRGGGFRNPPRTPRDAPGTGRDRDPARRAPSHRDPGRGAATPGGPTRVLPWYRGASFPDEVAHPGLRLDKFCGQWTPGSPINNKQRQEFLEEVLRQYNTSAREIERWLAPAIERRRALVKALDGATKAYRTTARLVTGLGMTHVLETGFLWHPTLAVPYLPGSSIKGVIRAWVDPRAGWADGGNWEDARRLFGDASTLGVGNLVVLDALPTQRPELELDIVNVHYQPYYQQGQPPADYYEPEMVHFLVVKPGQEFEFALMPRPGTRHETSRPEQVAQARVASPPDVTRGFELLTEALEVLGLGAKTGAGYGRLAPASPAPTADSPGRRPEHR
jgi:CRISPR-associated protein Cmr6